MALTAKEKNAKSYLKSKANPFPCPDCGTIINKSSVSRHKKTLHHRYAVLNNAASKSTESKPAETQEAST